MQTFQCTQNIQFIESFTFPTILISKMQQVYSWCILYNIHKNFSTYTKHPVFSTFYFPKILTFKIQQIYSCSTFTIYKPTFQYIHRIQFAVFLLQCNTYFQNALCLQLQTWFFKITFQTDTLYQKYYMFLIYSNMRIQGTLKYQILSHKLLTEI